MICSLTRRTRRENLASNLGSDIGCEHVKVHTVNLAASWGPLESTN
jgi:hypothetical protein